MKSRFSFAPKKDTTVGFVFRNVDVEMPIVSVPCMCEHSDVTVEDHGGLREHRETHEQDRFIKRSGVYVIKLMVPKLMVRQSPFGKLGAP